MKNSALQIISLAFCLATASAVATAEDWPWFLGVRHTGVSGEVDLKLDWAEKKPAVLWRGPVGTGYSAPSVLGDRLVIHHRTGDQEIVSCRNVKDGRDVWVYSYPTTYVDPYGYNNGPRCSPVLTQERCITLGAEGMLVCTSISDGKLLWQHDFTKNFRCLMHFSELVAHRFLMESDSLCLLADSRILVWLPSMSVTEKSCGRPLARKHGTALQPIRRAGSMNGPTMKWW